MRYVYHNKMTVQFQGDPRANQKRRTRAAIVEAATKLARSGTVPSVGEAAEAALVSRATAYRYFPTQEALDVELATVAPGMEPVERTVEELTSRDAAERVRELVEVANKAFFDEEPRQRLALRVYLEQWALRTEAGEVAPVVRAGRRLGWIDKALEPVVASLDPNQYLRLRSALALTMGAEALVVMKDVCQLDGDSARLVLAAAAMAILSEMAGPSPLGE